MKQPVRVRFAPSPTGPLHIGGVRTALFNYLFAKKHGGQFLLRIEDTDQGRFVPGAEDYIRESLEWCGISPDESPWNGGPCAPYRQSERKDMYQQYVHELLEKGHAYYAFDTSEELEAVRKAFEDRKENFQYNAATRGQLRNSFTMPAEEVSQLVQSGANYVVRLNIEPNREIVFTDLIRGEIRVMGHTLDDKVLMKSDGMPTYHLANIVDDHLMDISHVIRGEEWLPSAPMHVLMYQYFGWEAPQFAHLPLLLKPNGQGKLSKRDGDKLGFAVFPLAWTDPDTGAVSRGYREDGFLPDALVNFLALLGWNPGTDQEIFSLAELVEAFSLERIHKAGTKFDIDKAKWFNQTYLKHRPVADLALLLQAEAAKQQVAISQEKALAISELMRERVVLTHELFTTTGYFFEAPQLYDEGLVRKRWTPEVVALLAAYAEHLPNVAPWGTDEAKAALDTLLASHGLGAGKVMLPLRVALTGSGVGPDLMPMIGILGAEEVASRIRKAIEVLGK